MSRTVRLRGGPNDGETRELTGDGPLSAQKISIPTDGVGGFAEYIFERVAGEIVYAQYRGDWRGTTSEEGGNG